jgi:hypothetical protein
MERRAGLRRVSSRGCTRPGYLYCALAAGRWVDMRGIAREQNTTDAIALDQSYLSTKQRHPANPPHADAVRTDSALDELTHAVFAHLGRGGAA